MKLAGRKRGLSGLYLLLILFTMMLLFGGPALVRMINIILFGQCNVAPEATKMKETIEKVCQGTVGDIEQMDYPSCPVFMKCDNCATAAGKAAFRTGVGIAQTAQLYGNLKSIGKSLRNGGKSISNLADDVSRFKAGLSGGKWTSIGGWKDAYRLTKWNAELYRPAVGGVVYFPAPKSTLDYSNWEKIGAAAKTVLGMGKDALFKISGTDSAWSLYRKGRVTGIYVLIASRPDLRPDIQQKVGEATEAVLENLESVLCDSGGAKTRSPSVTEPVIPEGETDVCGTSGEAPPPEETDTGCGSEGMVVLPIDFDVYLITKKEADPGGALASLSVRSDAQKIYADAHGLSFDLNVKLLSLFTAIDDGPYANAAFGQGSCMQPSSPDFNSIPSSYSEVEGACTMTSTVKIYDGKDCDPADAGCLDPPTLEDRNREVDENDRVLLRRNHSFRFLNDLRAFLSIRADELGRKNPANKAGIEALKTGIDNTLSDAIESASKVEDPWYFAYVAMAAVAEDVAGLDKYDSSHSLAGWYTDALDSMNSVNELISGKLSEDGTTLDGLEQKHGKLAKIRNEAFDILSNGLPSSQKDSRVISGIGVDDMTITFPLYSVISSCNQDDRLLAQSGKCEIAAVNLDKKKVQVDDTYFPVPYALPIADIDYGTTVNSLQVPIGFISGLVGGSAGRAVATTSFALQNCPAGGFLNPESSRSLLFCMKAATPQCVLPGGCEVCFVAKCNTEITCNPIGAANLRVEKKSGGCTELTGPVKPL